MSCASYNRGSRVLCRRADKRMPLASRRAEHQAHKDRVVALREQVAALEHQLASRAPMPRRRADCTRGTL